MCLRVTRKQASRGGGSGRGGLSGAAWGASPTATLSAVQSAQVARIDGAVSGTPFFIALVPGYLAYLWQEGVMERRIAALYGSDPREAETCARTLVLRGVHPTIEAARQAVQE